MFYDGFPLILIEVNWTINGMGEQKNFSKIIVLHAWTLFNGKLLDVVVDQANPTFHINPGFVAMVKKIKQ